MSDRDTSEEVGLIIGAGLFGGGIAGLIAQLVRASLDLGPGTWHGGFGYGVGYTVIVLGLGSIILRWRRERP